MELAPTIKYKVLVIGCGSIGVRHVSCLMNREDVSIAVCDTNLDSLTLINEISNKIKFFTNLEDAKMWNPSHAIVATPNEFHEQHTIEMLNSGAHVLCEKPIAENEEAATKMIECATKNKKYLQVGYMNRYRNSFEYLLKQIKEESLGNIIGGRALVGTYHTLQCAKSDFRSTQFGVLVHDYTHQIDLLGIIFGKYNSISALANNLAKKKISANPTAVSVLLGYEGGTFATLHMDYVQEPERADLEVFGDKKSISLNLINNEVKVYDPNYNVPKVLQFKQERNDLFCKEHEDFILCSCKLKSQSWDIDKSKDALIIADEIIKLIKI